MRRFVISFAIFGLAFGLVASAAACRVDQILTRMEDDGQGLCFTQRDRAKLASGWFTPERQDIFVVQTINGNASDKHMPSSSWHLRGAAIQATYLAFWSRRARAAEFERLTTNIRDCERMQNL